MPANTVSEEIKHLMREKGYSQDRAVAAALEIKRGGKIEAESDCEGDDCENIEHFETECEGECGEYESGGVTPSDNTVGVVPIETLGKKKSKKIPNLQAFYETSKVGSDGTEYVFDAEKIDKVVDIANKEYELKGYRPPVYVDKTEHGDSRELVGYAENIRAQDLPQIDVDEFGSVQERMKRTILFDLDVPCTESEGYRRLQKSEAPYVSPKFDRPQKHIQLKDIVFGHFTPHNRMKPVEIELDEAKFSLEPILCFQSGAKMEEKEEDVIKEDNDEKPEFEADEQFEENAEEPQQEEKPEAFEGKETPEEEAQEEIAEEPEEKEEVAMSGGQEGVSELVNQRLSMQDGRISALEDQMVEVIKQAQYGDGSGNKMIAYSSGSVLELSSKDLKYAQVDDKQHVNAKVLWETARKGDKDAFSVVFNSAIAGKTAPKPIRAEPPKPNNADFKFKDITIPFSSATEAFMGNDKQARKFFDFFEQKPAKEKEKLFKGITDKSALNYMLQVHNLNK